MKAVRKFLVGLAVLPLLLAAPVAAQEPARPPAEPSAEPESATAEATSSKTPAPGASEARPATAAIYQLPAVGKPRRRIGGGRRGPGDPLPELWALVPEHVAQTASEHPSLFWYLSDASPGYVLFELTLIDEGSIEPVVDVRLPAPSAKGLQRVDLGEHGVSLSPGQEYQWSLALVVDPEQRSRDVVASGWIERVPAPDALSGRLAAAGPLGAAQIYAESGLWYDALDAIWQLGEARPDGAEAQRQLDALLAEVGLPSVPLGR
jgi:hypothetical protein